MFSPPDDLIDLAAPLPTDAASDSPDSLVWRLLCARTLEEVDPGLGGILADDIAVTLCRTEGYRMLAADTAAYLWLARTHGESEPPAPEVPPAAG